MATPQDPPETALERRVSELERRLNAYALGYEDLRRRVMVLEGTPPLRAFDPDGLPPAAPQWTEPPPSMRLRDLSHLLRHRVTQATRMVAWNPRMQAWEPVGERDRVRPDDMARQGWDLDDGPAGYLRRQAQQQGGLDGED